MLKVFLIGNLGADPETRFAPSGQKITSLRVASNSKRQGKEETTWYRVTIFGDRFDKMTAYLCLLLQTDCLVFFCALYGGSGTRREF